MVILRVFFAATALAEIVGCYLTWRVIKQGKSGWLLGMALIAFQPAASTP